MPALVAEQQLALLPKEGLQAALVRQGLGIQASLLSKDDCSGSDKTLEFVHLTLHMFLNICTPLWSYRTVCRH